ncbi:MAG TPA: NADH-quinone oxidoreductase subunit NuoH, partial [Actinomycetales bacterium]|nr:NADH-quinone oxidoreductase subunit NuoH [Actinomycetales bacterium]
ASFFWPQKSEVEPELAPEEFDAFAAGYPVPPLPGQTLPASPRPRGPRAAQTSAGTLTAEAATADKEVSSD